MRKIYFASGLSIVCAICFCVLIFGGTFPSQGRVVPSSTMPESGIAKSLVTETSDNSAEIPFLEEDNGVRNEKVQVAFNPDPEMEKERPSFDPSSVIVKLMEGFSSENLRATISSNAELAGMAIVDAGDDYAQLSLPSNIDVAGALEKLNNEGIVQYVQPNYFYYSTGEAGKFLEISSNYNDSAIKSLYVSGNIETSSLLPQASFSPKDPFYVQGSQWGLNAIGAKGAWGAALESANLQECTIAILDSGFRYTHEDLSNNVIDTYDAANQGQMDFVNMMHGSGVAGVAGAVTNNDKGVASISGNNCKLMLVKIADNSGAISTGSLLRGLDYVYKNATRFNIRVINMSLGQGSSIPITRASTDPDLYDTISKLRDDKGILTVVAACNRIYNESGTKVIYDLPFYAWPSDFDNVVSVINVVQDSNREGVVRSDTSNYNVSGQKAKNISAPGGNIYTTGYNTNTHYVIQSGTSFAAPLVSGIAGLMFAANPNLTPYDVEKYLYSTANDLTESPGSSIGWDRYTGYGLVNANLALNAAVNKEGEKKAVSSVDVIASSVTYTGKALSPAVKVYDGQRLLKKGRDYTIVFKNNVNAGKGTYVITGKGTYTGTKVGQFTINKRALKSAVLKKTSIVYDGKSKANNIKAVHDNRSTVVAAGSFAITYYRGNKAIKTPKSVGPVVVKIVGKGNYKGTIKKTFKIIPKGTIITGFNRGKNAVKVKWAKSAVQTDGFQVRYSKDSSFSYGVKTESFKNGKRTAAIVERLSSGSRYYFTVRSYKKVDGKVYFSSWAPVKGTKTK